MKRVLPSPLMSAFLLGLWLLMNQSLAPADLLLGAALALAVPLLTNGLRPLRPRVRRPDLIARHGLAPEASRLLNEFLVARKARATLRSEGERHEQDR